MAKKWLYGIVILFLVLAVSTGCNGEWPGSLPPSPTVTSSLAPGQTTLAGSQTTAESVENPEPTGPVTTGTDPVKLEINTGLPVLYLEFDLSAVYKDKDTYQAGSLSILEGDPDSGALTRGPFGMEIKGRGNSTWQDDKRSFHLQLDKKLDLFGLGANKHWLLLGQSSDLTMMKNKVFFDLSHAMGLRSMQSTWVELVVNNQHAGNYLLCEKINHSESLALPEGLIYELDSNFDEKYQFKTTSGQPIMLHTHKYLDAIDSVLQNQIQERLQAFENAVSSPDFQTTFQGKTMRYSEMIDMDSLAKYWLIQELTFNPSIFKNSTFFFQESREAPYQMGPVWDMDQSTGDLELNYPGYDRWGSILWGDLTQKDSQTRSWHKYFIHDPEFIAAAHQAYWDNHELFMQLIAENGTIFQARELLLPSAVLNYQLWENESNAVEAKDDYKALVRDFKAWLTNRISWLDQQFQTVPNLTHSLANGTIQ